MATRDAPRTTWTFPAGAFRQIGWAFLFLGISVGPSFRLGHESFLIDVLPDFIGYLMIATAANRLVPLHRRARGVRNLALFLSYLTIPTIIQYTVVTSQSGNITTWTAPLWPLTVAVGLLELVLVWGLCGLVADLARLAGDDVTEQKTQARRVAYVLFKVLLTGGLVLVLVSPNRELIIGGAIAAVAVGLLLLGLMMGLMRRAERMCEERPRVAGTPAGSADAARPGGWVYRLLVVVGAALPIALAAGAVWYYQEWSEARQEEARKSSSSAYFEPARGAFYGDLLAGRIDEAYASTTPDFRIRISRENFAELARNYLAFAQRRGQGRGASGAGSTMSSEFLTAYEYSELEPGKIVQVSITVRRDRDSILVRRPPPVKVDDFKVEEKPIPGGPRPAFGGRPGPGR
jgi:hypothetical protein